MTDPLALALIIGLSVGLAVAIAYAYRERKDRAAERDGARRRLAEVRDTVQSVAAERDNERDAAARSAQRAADAEAKLADERRGPELTAENRAALLALYQRGEKICVDCGGMHGRTCLRVRRLRFRADGQTRLEVEYWPDWPTESTVWPEQLFEEQEAPAT